MFSEPNPNCRELKDAGDGEEVDFDQTCFKLIQNDYI